MPFKFEKVEIWKLSIAFANDVHLLTRKFPKEETFGLTSQFKSSKSQLIRDCLQAFLDAESDAPVAWELGKELFGKVGSGRSDLSQNRKQIVRDKLNGSHRRR